jgi:hypothetical protein
MASFEYNPLSESVTVTYECPQCGHVNKDTFSVPTPDLTAETHHDSINQDFSDAICEECEQEFNVIMTNGFYGGYGEIEDVDSIIDVEENIPGEDDEYYDKLLFKETHSDTEKTIEAIEELPREIKDNLYRLLYANIISKLEAFLCDTIVNYVLSCEAHKRQFVQKYEPLATQKFQMSAIYAKYDSLDMIIKGALTSIVYHDIELVRKLYKKVADIELPNTKSIEEAIQIRHDIVHRNGKDKDGNLHTVTRTDVEILSDHVMDFIYEFDSLVSIKEHSEALVDGSTPI